MCQIPSCVTVLRVHSFVVEESSVLLVASIISLSRGVRLRLGTSLITHATTLWSSEWVRGTIKFLVACFFFVYSASNFRRGFFFRMCP